MNIFSLTVVVGVIFTTLTYNTVLASPVYEAKPKDYSCYYAESWATNTNKHYNSYFSAYTDVLTSGYISSSRRRLQPQPPPPPGGGGGGGGGGTSTGTALTTGWKVTFKGIPNYDHTFTASEVAALNARPKKSSDFSSGATTAKAGDYVEFGKNIGYVTTSCSNGYWPPGPSCPTASDRSYVFPIAPAPETKSDGCYTGNSLGYYVNGIPVWSWSDTVSYKSEGVWHNTALEFEQYDMDVCIGHSAQGEYHRKFLSLFYDLLPVFLIPLLIE